MLGIEIVREIDIRLVTGIYCQLRFNRPKANADHRYEVLKRKRYRDRAMREYDAQAHDVRRSVDEYARRADKIGTQYHVVTVAPQVVQHDIIRLWIRCVTDAQRTRAYDLRRVSAEATHAIGSNDRGVEPDRKL